MIFIISLQLLLLSLSTALQENQQILQILLTSCNKNYFPFLHQGKGKLTSALHFTPNNNYTLSRYKLVNLFSRVASSIVTILTAIANSPGAAHLLPRIPGQRKDLWHVPALFGDTPMKKDCLPLGFQFQPCPDQGRRCDLSGCSISSNSPWKIFEGCWHSFHLCCLTVVTVCPICSKGIEDAIKSLGAVANQTIHTRQNATDTDGLANEGGEDTVESRTSHDDNDDEPLTSSIDGNVEQAFQNLTIQIMTLSIAAQPVQPLPSARGPVPSTITPPSSSSQRRAPHCSTCGHLRQGHQRPVSQGSLGKCSVCPSQICSRKGRRLSFVCEWCGRQRQSQTNSNPSLPLLPQAPIIRETRVNPDVTEWLLFFSQSTATPAQGGSNAGTIISVYGAVNFLMPSTNWILPSPL